MGDSIFSLTAAELEALWLSTKVACLCVVATAVPGVVLGWLLARVEFRAKTWVQAAVQLPLVMPPVLIGYLLLVVFGSNGYLGGWLQQTLGIHIAFTWWAAVMASAVVSLPLVVRSVRLAIEAVDHRLEQAARVSGASAMRVWWTVTLPLAWPGVLLGLMLAFVRSLGEFGATITFAGNIAGQTRTLPLALYRAMETPGQEHVVTRIALLTVALSIVAVVVSEWLNRRAIHAMSGRQDDFQDGMAPVRSGGLDA